MSTFQQMQQAWRERKRGEHIPWRKAKWFYMFISPWIIGFLIFTIGPIIAGVAMSFTNFDGMNINSLKFIGLRNYATAIGDPKAIDSFKRVMTFSMITLPINMITPFLAAVLLTRRIRGQGLFRTLFYIPSVIPLAAAVWIWKIMFDNNFGVVNAAVDMISPGKAIPWMTNFPMVVLILSGLWAAGGGSAVMYMAALQSVPKELEEASMIDGAGTFQRFIYVTLPLITPMIFYQLILAVIFIGQIFVEPILLFGRDTGVGGGLSATPPRSVYFYMIYIFDSVFKNMLYGYGFALLLLLYIFTLTLTIIVFSTARFWVYYEVDQS